MILFRCDANPLLGFGHLMRCRQLAGELKARGHSVALFGPAEKYRDAEDAGLFAHLQVAAPWTTSIADAEALLAFGKGIGAKAYVLDDFRVDPDYQLTLRQAGARWMQLDSRTDRDLWPDILFSASASADPEGFRHALRNPATRLLVGTRYALLRPAFRNLPRRQTAEAIKKVLLTFGGGSDRGAFTFVLDTLLPLTGPDVMFTLVSGANNPNNEELKRYAADRADRVRLTINPDNVADLMVAADLAIMAAGTTTLEAAAAGLPLILFAIAENQILPATAWMDRGAGLFVGELNQVTPQHLVAAFEQMRPAETRHACTEALYRAEIDGCGATRVAEAIEADLLR